MGVLMEALTGSAACRTQGKESYMGVNAVGAVRCGLVDLGKAAQCSWRDLKICYSCEIQRGGEGGLLTEYRIAYITRVMYD